MSDLLKLAEPPKGAVGDSGDAFSGEDDRCEKDGDEEGEKGKAEEETAAACLGEPNGGGDMSVEPASMLGNSWSGLAATDVPIRRRPPAGVLAEDEVGDPCGLAGMDTERCEGVLGASANMPRPARGSGPPSERMLLLLRVGVKGWKRGVAPPLPLPTVCERAAALSGVGEEMVGNCARPCMLSPLGDLCTGAAAMPSSP